MRREAQELGLRLFELGEMLGFLSQAFRFQFVPVPGFQLFLRLLCEDQEVAHTTGIEDGVSIDVPDLIRAAFLASFGSKVALRLAAETDHLEEMYDRIVLTTIKDLT
jgi:hypothetical protein